MGKKLYLPKVQNIIHSLDRGAFGSQYMYNYDAKNKKNIDTIFSLIKRISPVSENGCRQLWFRVERGNIEDWDSFEDLRDMGEVETREEYEELWESWYPEEEKWFEFLAVEDEKYGYRSIVMNNSLVIEINQTKQPGVDLDLSEFTGWIIDQIKGCMKKLKAGTYMDYVRKNLSAECRTGTILMSELWSIHPQVKENLYEGLTKEDVAEFLSLMKKQPDYADELTDRIHNMTVSDFYYFCAVGYQAMGYEGCDKPTKDQYYLHADGRDEGLSELAPYSPEAFETWLTDRRMRNGHPWEVCRGGNSTHISLYPQKDKKGYYLILRGSSWARSTEAIQFYLALIRAEIPVFLYEGDIIARRMTGEEKIGIVPRGIIPKYRSMDFPGENIITFMNLPYEDEDEIAAKCVWQDIPEVHLLEE